MADDEVKEPQHIGQVSPRNLETEMEESYLDYAMSVIVARALPDVRDGLKPVHRRVLYAMWEEGARSAGRRVKSSAIVGEVMKSYHPHGDMAIYDTVVRLAQDFAMRYQLVDGQGNFGSIDGDSAAASRYTEVKMARIAEELLFDIDKETVDFIPNYDATKSEPRVLPAKLPQLLLNGTVGIAVGMATSIPPHHLGELVDALVRLIDEPDSTAENLHQILKGPDFPTGGHIYDAEEIAQAYLTGRGKVVMRGTAEIEEKKGAFRIIITEIPYQVNKSSLIEKIADLHKEKKIEGISDLRDESDREGIRIVIELGRNAYPKKVLNRLFELTTLQTTFHVNMLALVNGIEPRVLNLRELLQYFLDHRIEVIRRRTEFDLKQAKARAHILEGLRIALKHIDEVIALIKKSESREAAHQALMVKFTLSELQSNAILDMRLSQLAALERKKIDDEYDALMKLISELETLLASPKKILALIRKDLEELKTKYAGERRTRIHSEKLGEFSAKDLIPDEQVVVLLTADNYIKRMPTSIYRSQGRGGKGVMGVTTKEEDTVSHLLTTSTHDDLYLFTDRGRVFRTKVYELPNTSRAAKGQALVNVVQIAPDEKVTSVLTLKEGKQQCGKFLIFATEQGVVKKTDLRAYEKVRKTGLQAIKLHVGDVLRWVRVTSGGDDIFEVSSNGNAMRYREEDVRAMGRSAAGVRGMRLKANDQVVSMDVVARDDPQAEMLVVLENGFGKRTKTAAFTVHGRGGVGIRVANTTEKAGKVVTGQVVRGDIGDVLIISKNGQTIRQALKHVKRLSREAQGVIVMRLNRGDRVSSVTVIADEPVATEPATASTPLIEKKPLPKAEAPSVVDVPAVIPSPSKKSVKEKVVKFQKPTQPAKAKSRKAASKSKSASKQKAKKSTGKSDDNLWGSNKKKKFF